MSGKWTQNNIPDQTGKIIVITGANSGLGLESTKILAGKGGHIVMAVRNMSKGEKARDEVLATNPAVSVDLMQVDMGDLSSIKAFADAFNAKYDRLDILLNNAGVMGIPRQETADGFEMQLGVNHLGHFALTGHLIDIIINTPQAHIHTVSSSANYFGTIKFDDINSEQSYGRWEAYYQSKLANVFFAFELQNRLDAIGVDTISNSSHPGLVMTNLQANSVQQSNTRGEAILYRIVEPILAQDASMGVLPLLYGATATDAKGGVFYGPRLFNLRGYPAEKKPNDAAHDRAALQRLWEVSKQMTGVTFGALKPNNVKA